MVTGASSGIGAAISRCLVTKGIRVVGVARTEHSLRLMTLEKIGGGGSFEYVVGDLADAAVQDSLMELAVQDGHELIGLVLNAAVVEPIERVVETDVLALRRAFDVNYFSNIRLYQLAHPHLLKARGTIIGLTSGIVERPSSGMAAYCSYSISLRAALNARACRSKAAFNLSLKVMACEEPEITIIGVRPGLVNTAMLATLSAAHEGLLSAEQRQFLQTTTWKDPSIPAGAISQLVLSHGSTHPSGSIIDI